MQKLTRHRIAATNVNNNKKKKKIKFVYINDQLTGLSKKLLWVAKTKAREFNWRVCLDKRQKVQFMLAKKRTLTQY